VDVSFFGENEGSNDHSCEFRVIDSFNTMV
jgi:hypothetical protein